MKNIKQIVSMVAIGIVTFNVLNSSRPTLLNLDQFVLVAADKIHIAKEVQISSGDLAANEEISIAEKNIINGALFADKVRIAEGTAINSNASFNQLKLAQNSQILGTTSTPISLPVVELLQSPDFTPGTENLIVEQDQTINTGNFNKIEVKPGIALVLTPGTYNLNILDLRENSKLLFSGPATINIKGELKINAEVLVAQNVDIASTDLRINYAGKKAITAGDNTLLSLKLFAPEAKVNLGARSTLRGQILANEINAGENSILSREDFFSKESDPEKVVEDQGIKFIVNEIVVLLKDEAMQVDAQKVADLVEGRITGFVPTPKVFKIEVQVVTAQELLSKIQVIKDSNDPLAVEAVQNLASQ